MEPLLYNLVPTRKPWAQLHVSFNRHNIPIGSFKHKRNVWLSNFTNVHEITRSLDLNPGASRFKRSGKGGRVLSAAAASSQY